MKSKKLMFFKKWPYRSLVVIAADTEKLRPSNIYQTNMHKHVIAQHATFLTRLNHGNADSLKKKFSVIS